MKLTKFVHSCVLVEHENKAVLFDPGIFSWNSGLINVASMPMLDAVVVSHKHPDHCAEPFVRELATVFPDAQWFAPSDTHDDLKNWGVVRVSNQSQGDFEISEGEHAPVEPFSNQVMNLVTHWASVITQPGDSHNFSESKEVLLLPVQAPWGTTVRAVNLALELKPKYVLPIHDWMWRDEWREMSYDRLEDALNGTDITFLRPIDGKPIEVQL
jgi:L-ascorbate metabolism protein UlaG (beta-lactamase superfamily)